MIYILVITAIVGVGRFFVPVSGLDSADIYKDIAHIWVGILVGAAWYAPWEVIDPEEIGRVNKSVGDDKILLFVLALGLTLVEVIAVIVRS